MGQHSNRAIFDILYANSDIKQGIPKALQLIGERFDVSRVYIFENTDDGQYANNTFEWCAEGIEPQKDYLQHMSYKEYGYRELFEKDGLFFSADVTTLSPVQRALFEAQGIKATIQYAMYEKGAFRGLIGFDDCNCIRPDWDKDEETLDTLTFLSQILTVYLLKERNLQQAEAYHKQLSQALMQSQEQLNGILKGMNGGIAMFKVSNDGKISRVMCTDGVAQLHGCSPQEYEQMTRKDVFAATYAEDYSLLHDEVNAAIPARKSLTFTYRGFHKVNRFVWINLSAVPIGEDGEGNAQYTAIFTTVSREFSLYQDLMDKTENGIVVTDRKTNEVYFVNRSAKPIQSVWMPEPFDGNFSAKKLKLASKVYQVYTHPIDWMGRAAIARYFLDISDEVELQNRLSSDEERYRMVVEQSHIAFMDYDVRQEKRYSNDLFKQYAVADKDNTRVFDYASRASTIHPDDRTAFHTFCEDIASVGVAAAHPIRLQKKDGTFRWSELHGITLMDEHGQAIRKICFIRDVDDATRQYRDLKARYDFEMEKQDTPDDDVIEKILIDLTANQVHQASGIGGKSIDGWVGLSVEEMLSIRLTHTTDEKERSALSGLMNREALLNAYLRMETREMESKVHQPGVEGKLCFRTTVQTIKNPENEHVYAFFVTRNVDRQKTEALLMHRLLEVHYSSVVLVFADTGRIKLEYSRAARGFVSNIDMTYDEVTQVTMQQYVLPTEWKHVWDDMRLAGIKAQLEKAGQASGRAPIMRDGKMVFKTWTASYFDEERELILITTADATDAYQRDLENSIRLAEALENAEVASKAKSTFLARMSHEIRTPITTISGILELIRQDCIADDLEPEQLLSRVEIAANANQYLLTLINDILDISKIESSELTLSLTPTHVRTVITPVMSMIRPLAEKKHIRLVTLRKTNMSDWYIMDGVRVSQIMMNLLSNAVKFTPEGGTITYSGEVCRTVGNQVMVRFIVSDTGVGIAREFLPDVFEPFKQEYVGSKSPYGGTGIGLSISRSLARLMGGDITVESEKGKGATFTATMQWEIAPPEQKRTVKPLTDILRLDGRTALLCEDNQINQMIARQLLEKQGCRVLTADDGRQCVTCFDESNVGDIDFILMDIRMPHMDGLEATRIIRALRRPDAATVPIIAMSANAYEEDRQLSLQAGMNDHLSKPVAPRKLLFTIKQHLK